MQRDFISRNGLTAKIRAVPVTSNLVELYQAADWCVHPTQYDAFSSTVLQSMACGLPGLVSVMDGAVDHIRNGVNGSCSTILSSRKSWPLAFKRRSISMKNSARPCLRQLAKPWWL
ncbi:glycosyltransferase [Prosthecobacter sp.]